MAYPYSVTNAPKPFSWEQRFKLYVRTLETRALARYSLQAPDLLENLWAVFDRKDARTIARGGSAEIATDNALHVLGEIPEIAGGSK